MTESIFLFLTTHGYEFEHSPESQEASYQPNMLFIVKPDSPAGGMLGSVPGLRIFLSL